MKILLFISVVGLVGLASCKKCQTCTTTVTQDVGFFPVTTSTSQEYCGKEYDDAPPESSVNQEVGGISQSVTITCADS